MQPKDLKYTKTHEWVKIKGKGNLATVGITDHAQSELGEILFVELPQIGALAKKDAIIGTVESLEAFYEILAPVNGKIVEVNDELSEAPEKVNESPYHSGWMFTIEMSNPEEVNTLMSADDYEEFIKDH
ncbi:MAG: glycine cleavage system protein GcvH [Armatimonadota bacterium]|nr:glycine cleavage system protein GcvH [Armatimonadota bacterium]